MATSSTELPRDIQSEMHDAIDAAGERVAMGNMVEYVLPTVKSTLQTCTCNRYSKELEDGSFKFWNQANADCTYKHITPLPAPFTVRLAE